jgi:hypothetical protein
VTVDRPALADSDFERALIRNQSSHALAIFTCRRRTSQSSAFQLLQ